MKWFKHHANADGSIFIQSVLKEYGKEGYANYMLLLELLCEKFKGDITIQLTIDEVAKKLRIKPARVLSVLAGLSTLGEVPAITKPRPKEDRGNSTGYVFEIDAPILLTLKGKDFKADRASSDELDPRRRSRKKKYEEEEEVEKEEAQLETSVADRYTEKALVVVKKIPKEKLEGFEKSYGPSFIDDEFCALVDYAAKNPWSSNSFFKLEYITTWLGRGYSKKQSDLNNKKPPKTNLNGQVNVYDRLRAENPYKGEV